MRKLMLCAAAAALLTACQPAEDAADESSEAATATEATAPAAAAAETAADSTTKETTPGLTPLPPPQPDLTPAPVAKIAYAFRYALAIPKDAAPQMMSRHEQLCASAGPSQCQILSSQADWTRDSVGGRLEMRGAPAWINAFRANLATEAQAAGGKLETAVTEGENLTRSAQSDDLSVRSDGRAQERLKQLQAHRGGTKEQRLRIEQEIIALQRAIDEATVRRAETEDRLQSARLTVDYRPGGVFAADNPYRPVASALQGALGLSMGALSLIISLGAILTPIALIAWLGMWIARRRRKAVASA